MDVGLILFFAFRIAMGDPNFESFAQKANADIIYYQQEDSSRTVKRFLDEKLINLGKPKTQEEAQKIVFYFALYSKYEETPPQCALDMLEKNKEKFTSINENSTMFQVTSKILEACGVNTITAEHIEVKENLVKETIQGDLILR